MQQFIAQASRSGLSQRSQRVVVAAALSALAPFGRATQAAVSSATRSYATGSGGSGYEPKINLNFPNVKARARKVSLFDEDEDEDEGTPASAAAAAQPAAAAAATSAPSAAFPFSDGQEMSTYDSGLTKDEVDSFKQEMAELFKMRGSLKGGRPAAPGDLSQAADAAQRLAFADDEDGSGAGSLASSRQQQQQTPADDGVDVAAEYVKSLRRKKSAKYDALDQALSAQEESAETSSTSAAAAAEGGDSALVQLQQRKQQRQQSSEAIDKIKNSLRSGDISLDDALGKVLDELMSDPDIMEEALHGTRPEAIDEDDAKQIQDEISSGRLGIFRGGNAGGISDKILSYNKMNEKFYTLMKYEPVQSVSTAPAGATAGQPSQQPAGIAGYKVRIGKEHYLKTSKQYLVVLPNKTLANAVIAEWELQREIVRPTTLLLTELMCRVQDIREDELTRERMIDHLLSYFEAEEVCHREKIGPEHYLAKRIEQVWDPLVAWFNAEYGVQLKVFQGCSFSHDPEQIDAREAFKKRELPKLLKDEFALVTLHAMTQFTNSAVIALALYKGRINYDQAVEATQLMLREQTKVAGLVMGEHDLLFAEQRAKLSAASLFNHLQRLRGVMP